MAQEHRARMQREATTQSRRHKKGETDANH